MKEVFLLYSFLIELYYVAIGLSIVVLVLEYFFWRLFRSKIEGLLFPHETDHSALSFFTLLRLRICVLSHTVFLVVCIWSATLLIFTT